MASPSLAKNCVVIDDTVGFADVYSMAQYRGYFVVGKASGDMTMFTEHYSRLRAENKAIDIRKGEMAEIVEMTTIGDDLIAKVKTVGRDSLWMETTDLECH